MKAKTKQSPTAAPSTGREADVKLVAEMLSYDADYATNERQKETVSPKWSRYFESSMSYTGTRAGAARKKDPFAYREETRRGRRMLGGIVSTLNQAGADPRHKRQEAIQKQYFKRQQSSREDDDFGLRESFRKSDENRARQQASYELQVMEQKHSKMQWAAERLMTKAEPPIFYAPYKATKDQARTIKAQVKETAERVKSERRT